MTREDNSVPTFRIKYQYQVILRRRTMMVMMSSRNRILVVVSSVLLLFLVLSDRSTKVVAEDAEEEICACSPSQYTFTFNFALTCPPVNVTRNGGIEATFCQTSPFGDPSLNITDLTPVSVEYVAVVELGQDFEILAQSNLTNGGSYFNGDMITYTSFMYDNRSVTEFPKVVQLNTFGLNAAGQPIINFFALSYSNACDVYPVLTVGDSAGWFEFVSGCFFLSLSLSLSFFFPWAFPFGFIFLSNIAMRKSCVVLTKCQLPSFHLIMRLLLTTECIGTTT